MSLCAQLHYIPLSKHRSVVQTSFLSFPAGTEWASLNDGTRVYVALTRPSFRRVAERSVAPRDDVLT